MTQNRKRGRNLYEDEVEFMPLSKRINNLHINNGLIFENSSNSVAGGPEWGPGPPGASSLGHLPESPPNSVQSLDWSNSSAHHHQYSPDLSENQNPHYFNINKLLFQMYLERLQRAGCHDQVV